MVRSKFSSFKPRHFCNFISILNFFGHRWWQNWLEYVNQDESSFPEQQQQQHFDSVVGRPSVIDNSDLIYEPNTSDASAATEGMEELHDTLVEGRDYVLLPKPVWNQLCSW